MSQNKTCCTFQEPPASNGHCLPPASEVIASNSIESLIMFVVEGENKHFQHTVALNMIMKERAEASAGHR